MLFTSSPDHIFDSHLSVLSIHNELLSFVDTKALLVLKSFIYLMSHQIMVSNEALFTMIVFNTHSLVLALWINVIMKLISSAVNCVFFLKLASMIIFSNFGYKRRPA